MKVLFIDEKKVSIDNLNSEYLMHGFHIEFFHNTVQGMLALKTISYAAMIYVSYEPNKKILSQIKKWRTDSISVPIIILTECYNSNMKVEILNAGADDCLPISAKPNEVVARIRVVQRRIYSMPTTEISYGHLVFNTVTRVVTNYGRPVKLTAKEIIILELFLLLNPRLLTRRYLEDHLCSWYKEINSNIIEVHISNLRRKLGRDFIETVYGQGYRLKKLPPPTKK